MDIKVRDLKQTETIENENKLMVLVDDDLNLVKNITKEEFLTNVISSTENNALVQEQDGNLYVNTSEIADDLAALSDDVDTIETNIGDLADLTTENKTNLVAAINEAALDIDEIATDLNEKADRDGSNMVSSVKNFDGNIATPHVQISNATAIGTYNIDLSQHIPNDGYEYEVVIYVNSRTPNNGIEVKVRLDGVGVSFPINNIWENGTYVGKIGTNRIITMSIEDANLSNNFVFLWSFRRLGINQ